LGRYYNFHLFDDVQDRINYQEEFHRLWERDNILRNKNSKNRGLNEDDQREYDEIKETMRDLRGLGEWVRMRSELGLDPQPL
jgi:hypothetical protein